VASWRSSSAFAAFALLGLAWPAAAALDDNQRRQQAEMEAAREAAAQKALTDSLTDALAMLRHGSARAKELAAANIANMAIETTISQPFHPVTFRNACVRAGIVGELVQVLRGAPEHATPQGQAHALAALEAIATDDPTTELDNGHALAACEAGAVPPTVTLLSSAEEALHVGAAALAAVLAENPQCQTLLLTAGAVRPLIALGTYGNDAAKLRSIAALDLLALNNPAAVEAISAAGGERLLKGVARYGGRELQGATSGLLAGVTDPGSLSVAVDTSAHARQAHKARIKHSKVWQSATPVRRAHAPQAQHADDD